ncbi:MAG: hypothetical protein WBC98_09630 [Candidatus Zixiibacteriota bacterium]
MSDVTSSKIIGSDQDNYVGASANQGNAKARVLAVWQNIGR